MKTDTHASIGPQESLDIVTELTALRDYFLKKGAQAVATICNSAITEITMCRMLLAARTGNHYQQCAQELATQLYADGMQFAVKNNGQPPKIKSVVVTYETGDSVEANVNKETPTNE